MKDMNPVVRLIRIAARIAGVCALTSAAAAHAQHFLLDIQSFSASSSASAARSVDKAFDTLLDTRWESSNSSPGSWIGFELRPNDELRTLIVDEYQDRVRAWELRSRDANNIWVTVASGTTIGWTMIDLPAKPPSTSFRLYFPQRSTGQPSIVQLNAYGVAGGGSTSCTPYDGTVATTLQGEVDCGGRTFSNGCGTPIFKLAHGAKLKNANIHGQVECTFDCGLENVSFTSCTNPAKPSIAMRGGGSTLTAKGGKLGTLGAYGKTDVILRDIRISIPLTKAPPYDAGPSAREPQPPMVSFDMDNVRVENWASGPVAHIKTNNQRMKVRNLAINGYQPGAPAICQTYYQQMDFVRATGEQWNTPACDVSPSDIRSLSCNAEAGCAP